jgi:hypothetical protein
VCKMLPEVLTAVNMKTVVFWVMMSCNLSETDVSEDTAASTMNSWQYCVSTNLMKGKVALPEGSVHFYQTTRRYTPEDMTL